MAQIQEEVGRGQIKKSLIRGHTFELNVGDEIKGGIKETMVTVLSNSVHGNIFFTEISKSHEERFMRMAIKDSILNMLCSDAYEITM